jgi:hypothetical protein
MADTNQLIGLTTQVEKELILLISLIDLGDVGDARMILDHIERQSYWRGSLTPHSAVLLNGEQ